MKADTMVKECVQQITPDLRNEWEFSQKVKGGYTDEVVRYSGGKNYDVFCLLNMLWSPKDPMTGINLQLIRLLDNIPTSFIDEVFSIKKQELNYNELVEACEKHITKSNPTFNIIIPVRNRKDHLLAFLGHMNFVLSGKDDWCVTVIFQEETDEMFRDICSRQYQFNLNCIHLPHGIICEKYEDNMNRSLCYNLVSKMVECKWQINHDVDCIFYDNFIQNIENKTQSNVPWLQPYRGSRVLYLNENVTTPIIKQLKSNRPVEMNSSPDLPINNTPDETGAPGGSIVVRHKTFMEIGGYDPEFVWGYAPEDQLFWRKLEYYFSDDLSKFGDTAHSHPFLRRDVFSHETNVELFHLWHPPTQADHRYPFWSLFIANFITNKLNETEIKQWIQISKEKLA